MELPWNLCPFCGAPTPGKRREKLTLGDAMESFSEITFDESDPSLDMDLDSWEALPEFDSFSEEEGLDPEPVDGDKESENK
jgi:hypothetical protein